MSKLNKWYKSSISVFQPISSDRVFFLILCTLVIFVPFREILAVLVGPPIKLFADALVLVLLYVAVNYRKINIAFTALDALAMLFVIVCILSFASNSSNVFSLLVHVRSFLVLYVLYFILRNLNLPQNYVKRLFNAISGILVGIVIVLVFFALIEIVFNKTVFFPQSWTLGISETNFGRAYSLIGNPNTFAIFLLFSTILIIRLRKYINKQTNYIFYLAPVVGILASQSRSVTIITILLLIYIGVRRSISKENNKLLVSVPAKNIMIVVGIFIAILAMGFISTKSGDDPIVDNRYINLVDGTEVSQSLQDGRLYIIERSLNLYRSNGNYLLGVGSGMLNNQSSTRNEYGLKPGFTTDNQYLKIFVELGIVGSVVFVAFIARLTYVYRNDPYCLCTCVIFIALGLLLNPFETVPLMLIFWLLLVSRDLSRTMDDHTYTA